MADYLIPKSNFNTEIEVKRSHFIAHAAHTPSNALAKKFIQSLRAKYPDARHHCYAHITGRPSDSNGYGFSDDNEPSGTAGIPIFTHLKYSGLGEITVVIARYFGGTKLGTGGLARAYGDATKAVLDGLNTKQYVEMKEVILKFGFNLEADVRNYLAKNGGNIKDVKYSEVVEVRCNVPVDLKLSLPYSVSVEDKSSI